MKQILNFHFTPFNELILIQIYIWRIYSWGSNTLMMKFKEIVFSIRLHSF